MRILLVLLATVALGSCYSVGDLTATPFRCQGDQPECPDRYVCLHLDPMNTSAPATTCGSSGGVPMLDCICGIKCMTDDDCTAVSAVSRCHTMQQICY